MKDRTTVIVLVALLVIVAGAVLLRQGESPAESGDRRNAPGPDALGGVEAGGRDGGPAQELAAPPPVNAQFSVETTSFEGFPVLRSIPRSPRGLVFLFHGTGGGASSTLGLEVVDLLNGLMAQGVGFLATESTDRERTVCWNIEDRDPSSNADLARLSRLRDSLIEERVIGRQTPILAVGMSSGATFAVVFGHTAERQGWPMAAIAVHAGEIPDSLARAGGLRVPTFVVSCEHDVWVDNEELRQRVEALTAAGVSVRWRRQDEGALSPTRFTRIPGVSVEESRAIFDAFVVAGVLDGAGRRLPSFDELGAAFQALRLPRSAASFGAVRGQLSVVWGLHSFSATFKEEELEFLVGALPRSE